MNYGSEAGRTRVGSKSSSNKTKKLKRKKDEFHSHKKLHFQEIEPLGLEQVKERTILTLDRLGHQVLSSEPGGYGLQSWMKNFNSLLDDFQEKIGQTRMPSEFDGRRREINAILNAQPDSSEVESEIEKLLREQEDAKKTMEEEAAKRTVRLRSLREQRDGYEKDLKDEKRRLAEMNEANQSRQFFSRLLKAGPSTAPTEEKIKELESSLSKTADEIDTLQNSQVSGSGSAVAGAKEKAESTQTKIEELRLSKQAKIQLTRERELAATTMSEIVSKVQVAPSGTET
ncbi:MAG: hypothetical protein OK455_08775 [Thaumarchaeota archaeon]|nr:hypothetical protein [Nitrososphaerota archaeon]